MAASFLSSSALTVQSQATATRRLVVASAARGNEVEKVRLNHEIKKDGSNGRRDMMFAAAAAAAGVCSVAILKCL
ncbi:Photosystem II protein [Salix suchowensis]|nr:Photosystem II protein [Salix suchowensis]